MKRPQQERLSGGDVPVTENPRAEPRPYRTLLRYARPHGRAFAGILVLTVASSALVALQPWPMKWLVDHVLGQQVISPALAGAFRACSIEPTPPRLLLVIVAGGLALFALHSALEVLLTRAWTLTGRRMVHSLAGDLFARLQRRPLHFHARQSVGDTMSRVTGDSWCVHHVVDALCFAPAHALLAMSGMIFVMARLDPALTLLALAAAPLMVGASFLVSRPLRAAAKLRREIESRIHSHLQQTLAGIPVVQAFSQEERGQERFQQFASDVIRVQQRSALVGSLNSLSSGLVTTLGTGAILWAGAGHVLDGRLSTGGLLVFLAYLGSLQAQMKVLANTHTALQGFSASVGRVIEVLSTPPEIQEKPGALELPGLRGHIRFEHVTFGYEKDRPVLSDVSLEVQPGETIAILGRSGAGKTTLVNLLPRFIDPQRGRVLVDGHDVRDARLRSLRRQVAVVMQEPFLFPLSVADNIAYGRPDATPGEIEAAARAANAHPFIAQLPQGYDTRLGERGATLSGGERQRLSIARALLMDAPILILDEPTSALDALTEQSILDAMKRLMAGRTTLVIAHRLSTVRGAGRILMLHEGRIVESGSHGELMARDGMYAHLRRSQNQPRRETAGAAG